MLFYLATKYKSVCITFCYRFFVMTPYFKCLCNNYAEIYSQQRQKWLDLNVNYFTDSIIISIIYKKRGQDECFVIKYCYT